MYFLPEEAKPFNSVIRLVTGAIGCSAVKAESQWQCLERLLVASIVGKVVPRQVAERLPTLTETQRTRLAENGLMSAGGTKQSIQFVLRQCASAA